MQGLVRYYGLYIVILLFVYSFIKQISFKCLSSDIKYSEQRQDSCPWEAQWIVKQVKRQFVYSGWILDRSRYKCIEDSVTPWGIQVWFSMRIRFYKFT